MRPSIAPGETAPLKRLSRVWAAAVVAGLLALVSAATWPAGATWQANLGAVRQAAADLGDPDGKPGGVGGISRRLNRTSGQRSPPAPGHRTANLRLALMLMAAGRYDEAVGYAAAAWKTDRNSLTPRKALGLACVWTGDLDGLHRCSWACRASSTNSTRGGGGGRARGSRRSRLNAYRMSLGAQAGPAGRARHGATMAGAGRGRGRLGAPLTGEDAFP